MSGIGVDIRMRPAVRNGFSKLDSDLDSYLDRIRHVALN